MIIGYYEQALFGRATYCKLTKKDNEIKYKIEYVYSDFPNHIPEAEDYIKRYKNLSIDNSLYKQFQNKVKNKYIDTNNDIEKLIEYILKVNLEKVSKSIYSYDDIDDGTNWEIYIEINNKKYTICGYEIWPKEIEKIIRFMSIIVSKYLN